MESILQADKQLQKLWKINLSVFYIFKIQVLFSASVAEGWKELPRNQLYFQVKDNLISLGEFKEAHWQESIEPRHLQSKIWPTEQFKNC